MREVERVRANAGVGLEGDCFALGCGHYSPDLRVSRDLTLIEAEVIEDLARKHGIQLAPGETRRNLTTRGIRLIELIGRRLWVGEVLCDGTRLCEPCQYLTELTGVVHRGGLRAGAGFRGRPRDATASRRLSQRTAALQVEHERVTSAQSELGLACWCIRALLSPVSPGRRTASGRARTASQPFTTS